MKGAFFGLLLLTTGVSSAQQVGYRSIALTDSTRRYCPGAHPGDRLYYRPLELDCWYPAAAVTTTPIRYGAFLQLLEQRANRFQKDTAYNGLAAETAQYLCAGLKIPDTAILTQLPTQSYDGAEPIRKPFPLILYLCSYNGMSYEDIPLFESLAAHGYIVACITSVGRYPGNMTTDPGDLLEQVADAAFALRYFRQTGLTDTTHTGIIGYSWGGPAAVTLAMHMPVTAILSLDGSEWHYYGDSREEDRDFDRLRAAPYFHREDFHIPYAYLESDNKQSDHPADSIFNPHPTKYLRYPNTTHEDFSGLRVLTPKSKQPWLPFAIGWFDHYLKGRSFQLPADSTYPVVRTAPKNGTVISAKIIDGEDKAPLAFVNVGIPGKNLGTVTGDQGLFTLPIDPGLANDSLTLSMVGYQPQNIPLKALPGIIQLHRTNTMLTDVVVIGRTRKPRKLGNTTTSRFMSVGFPLRFLGAEIGVRIKLGRQPVKLKSFHCNVSDSRVDTALFRLNIYSLEKGTPQNVLHQNIFLPIGKRTGDYTVDLNRQNLVLKGDILVSLELIRGAPPAAAPGAPGPAASASAQPGALFFSASFLHSATWRRPTSQAHWKKAGGIGVGFNVEAQ
ncbi:carboxypeptidase-like regulatory domain-containing protein [Puia sp.]|jgi:hypothetical protein|uniref:carboxypeptidase-like regulatory domain-containing protein n=1 Tax=Puia sp. TaxID=2045100 RepID=UPI002F42DDF3